MSTTVVISLITINVMVFLFFSHFWCDCLDKYHHRVSVILGLMKQLLIILISYLKKSKLTVKKHVLVVYLRVPGAPGH